MFEWSRCCRSTSTQWWTHSLGSSLRWRSIESQAIFWLLLLLFLFAIKNPLYSSFYSRLFVFECIMNFWIFYLVSLFRWFAFAKAEQYFFFIFFRCCFITIREHDELRRWSEIKVLTQGKDTLKMWTGFGRDCKRGIYCTWAITTRVDDSTIKNSEKRIVNEPEHRVWSTVLISSRISHKRRTNTILWSKASTLTTCKKIVHPLSIVDYVLLFGTWKFVCERMFSFSFFFFIIIISST